MFEGGNLCASVFHVTALSPRPGRCGTAVDAGVGAIDATGSGCGGFDGYFAELPVNGTGSAGAEDFDGDDELDAPCASHFV